MNETTKAYRTWLTRVGSMESLRYTKVSVVRNIAKLCDLKENYEEMFLDVVATKP